MNEKNTPNYGKKIGTIINSALQSGDLSKLKELGTTVQDAVKDIQGIKVDVPGGKASSAQGSPPPAAPKQSAQPQRPGYGYPPRPVHPAKREAPPNLVRLPRGLPHIVLGTAGLVIFGMSTLVMLGLSVALQLGIVFVPLAVGCGVLALSCTGLMLAGMDKRRLADRITQLASSFQRKKVYTFDELAAETGRAPKQIRKDLRKARARGLLPQVHTDTGETCVMWGEESYQQYLEAVKARRQKESEAEERQRRMQNPVTADLEVFRSEGEATIRKMRAANKAIPGEEISGKLTTLEDTTARIFAYVEMYPEKLPDTRKFMNYYLPTTLKLIEKYRQYEEMDYRPENVRQARLEIEGSLDTINLAFYNLLESLYVHDTLDVSTDIHVLEKMLEQEGLTGKEFKIDGGLNDE